jgi:hypothetical protein
VIYLRDALNLTLNIANGSNPATDRVQIFGANNSDVINLGAGINTVQLGSASEVVHGGAGNDTVLVASSMLGATLNGGGGNNLLDITGGGTGVMGASITNFQVVQLQNAASAYDFTANGTSNLRIVSSSANDTIRAGSGGDTMWGHSGDTFVLGSGSDTVQGSAAQITGTTVQHFDASGSDVIDITDFHTPSAVTATLSSGVLSIAQAGGPTVAVNLAGTFTGAFAAAGDGHGGTAITFSGTAASGLIQAIAGTDTGSSGTSTTPGNDLQGNHFLTAHA